MTVTLELKTETSEKLRGKAVAKGMELPAYLLLLAEREADRAEPAADLFEDYPTLDDEDEIDLAKIRAGVERGLADFAVGRYKSAAEVDASMKARHGIPD